MFSSTVLRESSSSPLRKAARTAMSSIRGRFSSASANSKPHVVVALGGNALLKRKQDMTMENQRNNIEEGLKSFKKLLDEHTVTIVHGNGPQVGLLFLESAAYEKESGLPAMKLDVLDAETEGMIGYLLEQAIQKYIPPTRGMATVLSQILVDQSDPAFKNPTKFVGPVYSKEEADKLDGVFKPDGDSFRKVVASPKPVKMLPSQLHAVKCLTKDDCVVICAGGGGIPVIQDKDDAKSIRGVEAVIDKDRAACMMALELEASGLMILTDVSAVAIDYNTDKEKKIKSVSPEKLSSLMDHFPTGSMGPKVEAICEFVTKSGGRGAIGSLDEADKVVSGDAGTVVRTDLGHDHIEFY